MEFFKIVDIQTTQEQIQKSFLIEHLERINNEIVILDGNDSLFTMGCVWGEFLIRKDKITGGVRLTMLNCPNALSITITTGFPPNRESLILHLTINRTQKPQQFIDEINDFLQSWEKGIIQYFATKKPSN